MMIALEMSCIRNLPQKYKKTFARSGPTLWPLTGTKVVHGRDSGVIIKCQFIWSLPINGKEKRFSLHPTKKWFIQLMWQQKKPCRCSWLWDKDSDPDHIISSVQTGSRDQNTRKSCVKRSHSQSRDWWNLSSRQECLVWRNSLKLLLRNRVYSNGTDNNASSREDNKNSKTKQTKKKTSQSP